MSPFEWIAVILLFYIAAMVTLVFFVIGWMVAELDCQGKKRKP